MLPMDIGTAVRGICIFTTSLLLSSASDAFDPSTPVRAFADYTDAIGRCDRQQLEKIVHELPENFYMGPCNLKIERRITHVMKLDDLTVRFVCIECKPTPKFGDHMIFSIMKQPGFEWMKCGHLFRKFAEEWKLISWSCGDHQ